MAALRSKQNAARVHQAKMAHFFTPQKPAIQPYVLQRRPQPAAKKSAAEPKTLIGFWDKLYKYYSRKEKEMRDETTPKPVEMLLGKDEISRSNMKELNLVETFLESKFATPSGTPIKRFEAKIPKPEEPTIRQNIKTTVKKLSQAITTPKDTFMVHEIRNSCTR